jgi:hypothetical protein
MEIVRFGTCGRETYAELLQLRWSQEIGQFVKVYSTV